MVACTKPSVGDCFVIGGITKQSPTEGLVQAIVGPAQETPSNIDIC